MRASIFKLPFGAVVSASVVCALLPLKAAETIPSVSTLDGKTFEAVKVVWRVRDTVRIMHKTGIKTLSLREFDRESGIQLGLLEYEAEVETAAKAAATRRQQAVEAENRRKETLTAHFRMLDSKKRKSLQDWGEMAVAKSDNVTLATLKEVLSRPPDFQYGEAFVWWEAIWNPDLEKMEELTFKIERLPYKFNGKMTEMKVPLLEGRGGRYIFPSQEELAKKLDEEKSPAK